jgi:hypothetical protein
MLENVACPLSQLGIKVVENEVRIGFRDSP